MKDVDAESMEILAWVGPDEFDGSRGIKSGLTPVGWVPLAFKGEHLDRATRDELREGLQAISNTYGTTMQLVRFRFDAVVEKIEPTP